jgi:hypothetical protein
MSVVKIARQSLVPFPFLNPHCVGDKTLFLSAQISRQVQSIFSISLRSLPMRLIGRKESGDARFLPGFIAILELFWMQTLVTKYQDREELRFAIEGSEIF